MSILNDLYHENITLSSRSFRKGSKYDKLTRSITEMENVLFATLDPQEKQLHNTVLDLEAERNCISEEETFINGFRLGAQIMLEVLTEPDHQLI